MFVCFPLVKTTVISIEAPIIFWGFHVLNFWTILVWKSAWFKYHHTYISCVNSLLFREKMFLYIVFVNSIRDLLSNQCLRNIGYLLYFKWCRCPISTKLDKKFRFLKMYEKVVLKIFGHIEVSSVSICIFKKVPFKYIKYFKVEIELSTYVQFLCSCIFFNFCFYIIYYFA